MANTYFKFKTFTIEQQHCAMKVTTDACLFGAWVASQITNENQILDIGGGTGLLSLMIAHKNQSAHITSIEIESTCFQQLSENIINSPFAKQIKPVLGNILDFSFTEKFNVIISNPPFYENQLKSDKHTINQARHDASLPLNALFNKANTLLHDEGVFYVLLPYNRNEDTIKIAQAYGFIISRLTIVRQTSKHEPFRIMYKLERRLQKEIESEITIADGNGNYSVAFIELLSEYYLNL